MPQPPLRQSSRTMHEEDGGEVPTILAARLGRFKRPRLLGMPFVAHVKRTAYQGSEGDQKSNDAVGAEGDAELGEEVGAGVAAEFVAQAQHGLLVGTDEVDEEGAVARVRA